MVVPVVPIPVPYTILRRCEAEGQFRFVRGSATEEKMFSEGGESLKASWRFPLQLWRRRDSIAIAGDDRQDQKAAYRCGCVKENSVQVSACRDHGYFFDVANRYSAT